MRRLRTFWGHLGGLLALCLAFTLVFAPVADAAVCGDERPSAAAAQAGDEAASVSSPTDDDPASGAPAPSLGKPCHCHHTALLAPSFETEAAAHEIVSTPSQLRSHLARSRAPARLERPPRG